MSSRQKRLEPILSGDEEEEEDLVPPPSLATIADKISLAEIKGSNPLENEAETAILQVLEEEELDRADPDEPDQILPHLSDNDARAFKGGSESSMPPVGHVRIPENIESVRSSLRTAATQKSKRESSRTSPREKGEAHFHNSKGLETKLVGLTLAMTRIHAQSAEQNEAPVEAKSETSPEDEEDLTSDLFSGDAMVANANVLFRRSFGRQDGHLHLQTGVSSLHSAGQDHKKTDSEGENCIGDIISDGKDSDLETGRPSAEYPTGKPQQRQSPFKRLATRLLLKPCKRTATMTKNDVDDISNFVLHRKRGILFVVVALSILLVLLLGFAAMFFYALDNPLVRDDGASVSWVLIFIARHLVTASVGLPSQLFMIDYLSLRRRITVRLFGPWISLGLVQSRGYPFLLVSWSFFSFCFLTGSNQFAQHWLFYQDTIRLFNKNNPSGDVTSARIYLGILAMAMFNGLVISLKRLTWGLHVGKGSYVHFGDQVAKTIEQMILISEVSQLSVVCAEKGSETMPLSESRGGQLLYLEQYRDESVNAISGARRSIKEKAYSEHEKIIDEAEKDNFTGRITQSQRSKIIQLLDEFEEPEVLRHKKAKVSINAILEYRQALQFMDSDYPFSLSFGLAKSRVTAIESSQNVFERLLTATPGRRTLPFETIACLGMTNDGDVDQLKMKALIRLFRPQRDGSLSMLDFVKSCDTCYKDMRLLRASVKNTGQIDHSFEVVLNWILFVILTIITVAVLGYDPLALFLSLSSIILAFAFMISSASSKYFEGVLFILVRRPFSIGDRIHVSNVNSDTSAGGSSTWFVQNVDLFTTTVRYATTNEVATLSNGSLASSRIINAKRSPEAVRFVYMKFGVSVSYRKVQLFRRSLETFVKNRPREWLSLAGFRATRVEQDQGFIEYVVVLQHRESWQNIGPILNSTADVSSFCLELAKKLDMRYTAPPLPVHLTMKSDIGCPSAGAPAGDDIGPADVGDIAAMFEKREV